VVVVEGDVVDGERAAGARVHGAQPLDRFVGWAWPADVGCALQVARPTIAVVITRTTERATSRETSSWPNVGVSGASISLGERQPGVLGRAPRLDSNQ
jgi:hypothetical protein